MGDAGHKISKEIYDSIQTLGVHCRENKDCIQCPFYSDKNEPPSNTCCRLMKAQSPLHWLALIETEMIYKTKGE